MKEIILPSNSGLRDAYVAIMKEMYAIQQDNFWMQDIVDRTGVATAPRSYQQTKTIHGRNNLPQITCPAS